MWKGRMMGKLPKKTLKWIPQGCRQRGKPNIIKLEGANYTDNEYIGRNCEELGRPKKIHNNHLTESKDDTKRYYDGVIISAEDVKPIKSVKLLSRRKVFLY